MRYQSDYPKLESAKVAKKYLIYQLFRGGRVADSGFLVVQLESLIIALITHSGGRTLRSPGVLDDHKAAGVDYQSDYQNLQVRSSRTQSSPRDPLPGVSDNSFDNRLKRADPALTRDP